MNFLFDLIATQPNGDGAYHGGGKYAKKVFLTLANSLSRNEWEIFAVYNSVNSLDETLRKCAESNKITLIDLNNQNLSDIVKKYNINRFYSALPFSIMKFGFTDLYCQKVEIFVTIHGLRTIETPISWDSFYYIDSYVDKIKNLGRIILDKRLYVRDLLRYKELLSNTSAVVVSNHTKYSIMSVLPVKEESLKVFYSPDVTDLKDSQGDAEEEFSLSNYFLMVSGNRWLKNNLRSAKALDQIFTERPYLTQKVVITGVDNPNVYLRGIKNRNRFVFYNYVSEETLRKLYENAFVFIYMTLNEGFGYPPLEAMRYGVPTIGSSITSVAEICEDAILFSDPFSIVEIKNRILWLIYDHSKFKELQVKGKAQFEKIGRRQKEDLDAFAAYLLS